MPATFLAATLLLTPAASATPQDARADALATQISEYVRVIFEDKSGNGTDQRNGVNFDQQEGSTVGGRPAWGEIGAHAHVA